MQVTDMCLLPTCYTTVFILHAKNSTFSKVSIFIYVIYIPHFSLMGMQNGLLMPFSSPPFYCYDSSVR